MTPLEFAFASAAVAVLLISATAGLAWLIIVWLPRKWREAMAHVDRLADPGRCDWCDGFTADRRRCTCTRPCTFVPLCGAREEVRR